MKNLLTIIAALFLSALFCDNVNAEDYEKKYQESYKINSDALLKVINKYGDVTIENWSENTISIMVKITVEKSSQSKADDFFEKINIKLSGNSSLVSAVTEIDNLKGNNTFSIDYEIKAPKTISLDLTHKYGDANIDVIEGKVDVTLKYGDIVVQEFVNSDCNLDLKYVGQFNIEKLGDANIDVQYSEIDISKAGKLSVDSKYNEFDIDEIVSLDIESDYDDLSIETVEVMSLEGSFSDINVENLIKSFTMESDYGELDLNNVAKGFDLIEIETNHNDVDINIESGASYKIDLSGSYSSFSIPDGNYNINQPSFTSETIKGYVGSDANATSKIIVQGKYIDVKIR